MVTVVLLVAQDPQGIQLRGGPHGGLRSERKTLSLRGVLVVGGTFLESFLDPSLVRGAMAGIVDLKKLG